MENTNPTTPIYSTLPTDLVETLWRLHEQVFDQLNSIIPGDLAILDRWLSDLRTHLIESNQANNTPLTNTATPTTA
jgi:hypothetical protein